MKKLLALMFISAALAACSSGGGGGSPSSGVSNDLIVASNNVVTGMKTEVDNKAEVVAFVEDKLGPDYYESDPTPQEGGNIVMNASGTGTPLTPEQKFEHAKRKIQDLELLTTTDPEELQGMTNIADRLRDAWLISGHDANEIPEDDDELIEFIIENAPESSEIEGIIAANQEEKWEIDNAIFLMTDGPNKEKHIRFFLGNDKKINKVEMHDSDQGTMESPRKGDSNKFEYLQYEYKVRRPGSQDSTTVKSYDPLDFAEIKARLPWDAGTIAQLTENDITEYTKTGDFIVNTYGRDLQLAYSDFGKLTVEGTLIKVSDGESQEIGAADAFFAGGYDAKKIDPSDFTENVNFTGKAIGNVTLRNGSNNDSLVELGLNAPATLAVVFNQGSAPTETLNADFSNWYDVEMVKTGDDVSIDFDNYTNEDERYKFWSSAPGQPKADDINSSDILSDNNGLTTGDIAADIGYYGDNGIPAEATGVVSANSRISPEEAQAQGFDHDSVELRMAFGAKRD
jgi:hypothetical protein